MRKFWSAVVELFIILGFGLVALFCSAGDVLPPAEKFRRWP